MSNITEVEKKGLCYINNWLKASGYNGLSDLVPQLSLASNLNTRWWQLSFYLVMTNRK